MRQPQAVNATGAQTEMRVPRMTPSDRNRPRVAVVWMKLV